MMIIIYLSLILVAILHYYYCYLVMVAFNFNAIPQLLPKELGASLGDFVSFIFVEEEDILCLLIWLTLMKWCIDDLVTLVSVDLIIRHT